MKTQHYSCSLQTAHKILKIEWWDAFPIIYRAYHWLHIWLCSFLVTHFPALAIGQHTLSRPCPRYTLSSPLPLALVVTFSRVFFPSMSLVTLFPTTCHWPTYTFPPLSLVTHFPTLVIGYHFLTGYFLAGYTSYTHRPLGSISAAHSGPIYFPLAQPSYNGW